MRIVKKHTDVLSGALQTEELKQVKDAVTDDTTRGWCVFDHSGVELTSEGVTETATAVCSNVLDLAMAVGQELDETGTAPSISFSKGSREMQMEPLQSVNLLIVREKSSGFRKGI